MMISIADAKNHLPALVHQAEAGHAVTISRRGKAVAVMVSVDEYVRLQHAAEAAPSWMARLDEWRAQVPTGIKGLAAEELVVPGRDEALVPRIDFNTADFADVDEFIHAQRSIEAEPSSARLVQQTGARAGRKKSA